MVGGLLVVRGVLVGGVPDGQGLLVAGVPDGWEGSWWLGLPVAWVPSGHGAEPGLPAPY